jgi:hypothetical protein
VKQPKPASAFSPEIFWGKRVSRFGVNPKPTVKVRMKENGRDRRIPRGASFRVP